MPENKPPEIHVEDAENPRVAYEPSQADLRVVLGFLAALALAGVLIMVVLWGMFAYFRNRSAQLAPAPTVYSTPPQVPSPKLEADPVADYNVFHLGEQEALHSYGWVDQQAGTTRIPIDRAMDLLVQRGLPWKAPGTGVTPTGIQPNPATGPLPGTARQEDMGKAKR